MRFIWQTSCSPCDSFHSRLPLHFVVTALLLTVWLRVLESNSKFVRAYVYRRTLYLHSSANFRLNQHRVILNRTTSLLAYLMSQTKYFLYIQQHLLVKICVGIARRVFGASLS
ncbi:hypothetical protein TRVL_08713 [Trypanosoma vivax]|nr:hypothetical protein TRVL_08713 [Trypanosoma vivax]